MSRHDLDPDTFDKALAKLTEEMGEVLQVLGKIGRHGYINTDPKTKKRYDNLTDLYLEIKDVEKAIVFVKKLWPIGGV
jgi:hypothetical protein